MADSTTVMDSDTVINHSDPSLYHDRIFIVGGQKFYVLSQVLSLWSEHFRAMFDGNFIEFDKKEIEIKEVEPRIFKLYFQILYTNYCDLEADDLIPLIHLSFRFLTPHVLEFCKSYIDINFDELDSLKVDLFRTSCQYDIKYLKNKMIDYFKDDDVMTKFKAGDVVDIVIEYNLEDMKKTWLGDYVSKNVTIENCIVRLEACVNMPTLKESINKTIGSWRHYDPRALFSSVPRVPRDQFLDLMKAAFEYDVQNLKDYLVVEIRQYFVDDWKYNRRTYIQQYYDDIRDLPEDIREFIIRSIPPRS